MLVYFTFARIGSLSQRSSLLFWSRLRSRSGRSRRAGVSMAVSRAYSGVAVCPGHVWRVAGTVGRAVLLVGPFSLARFGALARLELLCRLTHGRITSRLFLCRILSPTRIARPGGCMPGVAIVAGLLAAQAGIFALHYLAPSSGDTMIRRFFLWQVLNLFEVPPRSPVWSRARRAGHRVAHRAAARTAQPGDRALLRRASSRLLAGLRPAIAVHAASRRTASRAKVRATHSTCSGTSSAPRR